MKPDDNKKIEVLREEILFNEQRLAALKNEYGAESEIKRHVKTGAFLYEIRTALSYWFGGQPDHRTSDALWAQLQAVDEGTTGSDLIVKAEIDTSSPAHA